MITKPTIYTEEFIKNEIDELRSLLLGDKEIVYLGELIETKPYSMQRFSEWAKIEGEISETIAKIKDILQTRAVSGGLKNKLNASITKFHLINNYDWKEKTETDLTTGGQPLTVTGMVIAKDTDGNPVQNPQ